MASGTKFIRVHGRVVPVRAKGAAKPVKKKSGGSGSAITKAWRNKNDKRLKYSTIGFVIAGPVGAGIGYGIAASQRKK